VLEQVQEENQGVSKTWWLSFAWKTGINWRWCSICCKAYL